MVLYKCFIIIIIMTCAKTPLQDLMNDVGTKSSGDEVDDIDLSSLSTSSSITSVNFDNGSPLTDWSDDSGLNC